jgi:hypothetical protein
MYLYDKIILFIHKPKPKLGRPKFWFELFFLKKNFIALLAQLAEHSAYIFLCQFLFIFIKNYLKDEAEINLRWGPGFNPLIKLFKDQYLFYTV